MGKLRHGPGAQRRAPARVAALIVTGPLVLLGPLGPSPAQGQEARPREARPGADQAGWTTPGANDPAATGQAPAAGESSPARGATPPAAMPTTSEAPPAAEPPPTAPPPTAPPPTAPPAAAAPPPAATDSPPAPAEQVVFPPPSPAAAHPGYVYPPGKCPEADPRPATLPFRPGRPAPQGYFLEEHVRRGPVIAGAIVLGVPYALGLSIAAGDNFSNQTGWLAVPALGPWITLATRENCATSPDDGGCPSDSGVRTVLVLDALMQATGATLLIWGLSSPHKRYVRDDVSLQLVPTQFRGGYGLGAVGTF